MAFLFVRGIFNDAAAISRQIGSNDVMINEFKGKR